jgi:hypothetical protein
LWKEEETKQETSKNLATSRAVLCSSLAYTLPLKVELTRFSKMLEFLESTWCYNLIEVLLCISILFHINDFITVECDSKFKK